MGAVTVFAVSGVCFALYLGLNMNHMDYNCQERKILNDGHLNIFVAAYTGWGAGNNPESFGVAFHNLGPTFINAYIVNLLQTCLIETEGKMGLIGLPQPRRSALSKCFI